jgi:hypothetical protein
MSQQQTTESLPKRSLLDIDAELDQIAEGFDAILNAQGAPLEGDDLPPTDAEIKDAIWRYFGEKLDERDGKLDGYASFIRQKEFMAGMRKAEADRLSALAKTDANAAKRLKSFLQEWLTFKQIAKIETKFNKFWIQGNGGKQPMTLDSDIDVAHLKLLIDGKKYVKTIEVVDTDLMRADLEQGVSLSFARLEDRGQSLRIK